MPPTPLLIAWAILLGLAVVLGLGVGAQGADHPTPFALSHTYGLVVCAELLVLLGIAPLVLGRGRAGRRAASRTLGVAEGPDPGESSSSSSSSSSSIWTPRGIRAEDDDEDEHDCAERRPPDYRESCSRAGLLDLALLWAMAAPVVAVAWWASDCDAASVAASQGHVLAVAWLVAGYLRVDCKGRLRGWYWLSVGALSAGAPLVGFVVGDLMRLRLTWLAALSPFWVAATISGPWDFAWEWGAPLAATVLLACCFQLWVGLTTGRSSTALRS